MFKHEISFFDYWGRYQAHHKIPNLVHYHRLPYCSLDRVVVATLWWEKNWSVRCQMGAMLGLHPDSEALKAWVMFFIALADLGKFDIRFQMQAMPVLRKFNRIYHVQHLPFSSYPDFFNAKQASIAWCTVELPQYLSCLFGGASWLGASWLSWVNAVCFGQLENRPIDRVFFETNADYYILMQDQQARLAWFKELVDLFLTPAGIALVDLPPRLTKDSATYLAGFFGVCDWLSSQVAWFPFESDVFTNLNVYLEQKYEKIKDSCLLKYAKVAQGGLPSFKRVTNYSEKIKSPIDLDLDTISPINGEITKELFKR